MALFQEDEVIEICSSDSESLAPEQPSSKDGLQLLREFIAVCQPLLKSNQHCAITKLLTDKLEEAKESYTQSEDFRSFLQKHIQDLRYKQKSVYVHIQDVKKTLMRASKPRRVQLTTVKAEKVDDARPADKEEFAEITSRGKQVTNNGRAELRIADQEKVEKEKVQQEEGESIAKNVRDKTDENLTLKDAIKRDPHEDKDVTKNTSSEGMEVSPVVAEEDSQRSDQQENEDIAISTTATLDENLTLKDAIKRDPHEDEDVTKNTSSEGMEVSPVVAEEDSQRSDQQENEDIAISTTATTDENLTLKDAIKRDPHEDKDVTKNTSSEAMEVSPVVAEEDSQRSDKQENEDIAISTTATTDENLTLKDAIKRDPHKDKDVTKNTSSEGMEVSPVVAEEDSHRSDQQENEDIAISTTATLDENLTLKDAIKRDPHEDEDVTKNTSSEGMEVSPVVAEEDSQRSDQQENEDIAISTTATTDENLTLKDAIKRDPHEDKDVTKNTSSEAMEVSPVVAEEDSQRSDKQENEDIAISTTATTDENLTLKDAIKRDPHKDKDVTKNTSSEGMEVSPVVAEEDSQRSDQQENEDISISTTATTDENLTLNEDVSKASPQVVKDVTGNSEKMEVNPAVTKNVLERTDHRAKTDACLAVEEDVKRADPPEVGEVGENGRVDDGLLTTSGAITSELAVDNNNLRKAKPVKESENAGTDVATGPSTESAQDDSLKIMDVGEGKTEVPETELSAGKRKRKDKAKGSQKQIRKLEKMLRSLDKAIKKLQERELTLDEMDEDDSAHIQEYQLRRRFVKVYNMLCELNDCTPTTGRVIEQRLKYEGTRFPEINRRLEKLVNKKDFFPDFSDIYKAVSRTNKKVDLGLNTKKVHSIAKEAFEDLGGKLQKRRQKDFLMNFSSHSTLDFLGARDSADKDPELRKKLTENRLLAKQNLRQVEDTFVKKQEECEKDGETLAPSEHTDSDPPLDGPSGDEEEEVEQPSKRPRLDQDESLNNSDEKSSMDSADENTEDRQIFATGDQDVIEIQDADPPISDKPSGQTTSTSSKTPHPRNVRIAATYSAPLWPNNSASKITHTISSQTLNERDVLSFDTPEQAVKSLKFDQPARITPSLPLVITNVCSLSENSGLFPGSDKDWDEGKATIARVVDDGSGGLLIGPPTQQRIMVVKSRKSVNLRTPTPITLSFQGAETNPSKQPLRWGSSVPTPSPPPAVSSTQPELDVSPTVQEGIDEMDDASVLKSNKRLEAATTPCGYNKQVMYLQSLGQTHTTRVDQGVVSDTSSLSHTGFIRCNYCLKTWKEADWREHSCVPSKRIVNGNVQSYSPCPKARTSSYVRATNSTIPGPYPQAIVDSKGSYHKRTTPSMPLTPQGKVFNLKNTKTFPQIKTSPKWQPSPRQLNLPRQAEVGQRAHPQRLTYRNPVPAASVEDQDMDVVVISDSDDKTSEKSGDQSESPDVICISDSD